MQGREADLNREQTEKEVFAKTVLLKFLAKVLVSGADDPEIILNELVAAQAAPFPS